MSDFSPECYKEFPSLQSDNERTGQYSEWSQEVLEERIKQYGYFLEQDPMPRAKATANRIASHLMFELFYRRGGYDDYSKELPDA